MREFFPSTLRMNELALFIQSGACFTEKNYYFMIT